MYERNSKKKTLTNKKLKKTKQFESKGVKKKRIHQLIKYMKINKNKIELLNITKNKDKNINNNNNNKYEYLSDNIEIINNNNNIQNNNTNIQNIDKNLENLENNNYENILELNLDDALDKIPFGRFHIR